MGAITMRSGTFFISFMDHLKGPRTVSAGQSPTRPTAYMLSNTRTILSAVLRPL
jgi:hypothetical protein